jgi:hypothetical protein
MDNGLAENDMIDDEPAGNTKRWLVSCDESGIDGQVYYGFGSLWMMWQRRGDFRKLFSDLAAKHSLEGELKWKKANNQRHLSFIEELVDEFFKRQWLAFHCIIIKKSLVDKSFHGGDYDLARRKHFTALLTNKMKKVVAAHPDHPHEFRVWVDPIASRYEKADESTEKISTNILNYDLGKGVFNNKIIVTEHDSKTQPSIQLCDLLLGAVMSPFQKKSSSENKEKIQKTIASYLGWEDLESDTYPRERKFNIWHFDDIRQLGVGIRHFDETRPVTLKYPLPLSNLQK